MPSPEYLEPYLKAVERHGDGFESLLWANPKTQAARFAAIARWTTLHNRIILDAGCGRADLLDYLLNIQVVPQIYIGLEAVRTLADAAQRKGHANKILRGDFVRDPQCLNQSADAIIFSGSLNTLKTDEFYATLHAAWNAARCELAFNFLCSSRLAANKHLTWHKVADVLRFAHELTDDVFMDDTYRLGDCTFVLRKA